MKNYTYTYIYIIPSNPLPYSAHARTCGRHQYFYAILTPTS